MWRLAAKHWATSSPHLIAGAVCFPSHWSLREKIGRPLVAVHGPVPLYAERLARPVDRLMTELKPGRLVERMNWGVVDDEHLFRPAGHGRTAPNPTITPHNAGVALFLRVERQTLSRIATGDVLFTIRVYVSKLHEAVASAATAARLGGGDPRAAAGDRALQEHHAVPRGGAGLAGRARHRRVVAFGRGLTVMVGEGRLSTSFVRPRSRGYPACAGHDEVGSTLPIPSRRSAGQMRLPCAPPLDRGKRAVSCSAMPMLTGNAQLAGIVGWPVAHSRSPRLHGYWLERMGIDGAYLPLAVRPGDFSVAIHGLRAAGFRGCNVTLPHKQAAFAICDQRDPAARRSGTVNTLVFEGGKILGRNTDGAGFIANLRAHGIDPAAGPVLVLGAGGAARAVAAALQDAGAAVSLANRTQDRAEALAQALPGLRVVPWQEREAALGDIATAGQRHLGGHERARGAAARPRARRSRAWWWPISSMCRTETPLLAAAAARGLRTVGGLGMLLHQAGLGFEAWFGARPEVDDALEAFVAADIARR